jgi:hypothetical protein
MRRLMTEYAYADQFAMVGRCQVELVDRAFYTVHFFGRYTRTPYYRPGQQWNDYAPAYGYGYLSYPRFSGCALVEIEGDLLRGWDDAKRHSRLTWREAREAIQDGWHYIERARPMHASC